MPITEYYISNWFLTFTLTLDEVAYYEKFFIYSLKMHNFWINNSYNKCKSKYKGVFKMHMLHGFGYAPFWTMILIHVLWLGLIIFGIYLITRFINGGKKRTSSQILKERLAKGEIDESEYERLKSIVERDGK